LSRKNAEAAWSVTFDDLLTLTGNAAAQLGGDFAFSFSSNPKSI
jgi:hypothetical protein